MAVGVRHRYPSTLRHKRTSGADGALENKKSSISVETGPPMTPAAYPSNGDLGMSSFYRQHSGKPEHLGLFEYYPMPDTECNCSTAAVSRALSALFSLNQWLGSVLFAALR